MAVGERIVLGATLAGRSLEVSAHALVERLTARRRSAPGGVPLDRSALTPAVLTAALTTEHPDVEVRSVRDLGHTDGTTSRTRVELDYGGDGGAGLPRTMFVKMTPGFSHRVLLTGIGAIEGEVRFYRDLHPRIPANVPEVFHVAHDRAGARFILLLEDLAGEGARFGIATEPLDENEAKAVLEGMARYHAPLWASPTLDAEFSWLPTPSRGPFRDFYKVVPMPLRKGLERAGDLVPSELADASAMLDAYWRLQRADDEAPSTLLHGDPHLGNLYFETDGTPGFLDWQLVRRGNWAHDVGYFIVSALEVEDRRRLERELLAHYLECLRREGVDAPDEDEAFECYRLQPAHGLPMWVGTLALGDYQAEEVCRLDVERFAAAAADLDTFDALRRWPPL